MENTQIKLSETVMVIDVAYLNFVINDLRKYFEPLLGGAFYLYQFSLPLSAFQCNGHNFLSEMVLHLLNIGK